MYAVVISASTSLFGAPMHLGIYHGRALWLACWKVCGNCIQAAEVDAEVFTHKETINTSTTRVYTVADLDPLPIFLMLHVVRVARDAEVATFGNPEPGITTIRHLDMAQGWLYNGSVGH